jgi:hypothetical protein
MDDLHPQKRKGSNQKDDSSKQGMTSPLVKPPLWKDSIAAMTKAPLTKQVTLVVGQNHPQMQTSRRKSYSRRKQ